MKETIADIPAKMRGLVKPGETLEHTYCPVREDLSSRPQQQNKENNK